MATGFHQKQDLGTPGTPTPTPTPTDSHIPSTIRLRTLRYQFRTHFHPYVSELVNRLIVGSIPCLQAADTDYVTAAGGAVETLPDGGKPRPVLYEELMTPESYAPTALVSTPYPVKELDFSSGGAYSVYNWELFYHVPITVAIHLSRNGRYEEAQRWFHYVFDPTDNSSGPTPERFWKVKEFQQTEVQLIEEVLINLATGADPELLVETIDSIGAWKDAPFRPHVVARYRPTAYMFKAVMAYLDNLVAWGDALFRQDSGESIDEARQLYVLAANVLGPRPQEVPRKGWHATQTYESLRADLDAMSNAIRDIEADIPFDTSPHPTEVSDDAQLAALSSLGASLYFCVPRNDKLLSYWDTVADRLFKIRNSLNIQGVFRQLPLFDPPIDPAMLARAAAAGLDVGAVVSGLNQPLPLVRFRVLASRASEICQEVKSLGGQLLSAIEKKDAETLTVLRSRQERVVLELAELVRYQAWQEAIKATEALEASLANAVVRYTHYEKLLGTPESDITVPELDELDTDALERMRFSAQEPTMTTRAVTFEPAQSDVDDAAGHQLNPEEAAELDFLAAAQDKQDSASGNEQIASLMGALPTFGANIQPWGMGPTISFGGSNLAGIFSAMASADRAHAGLLTYGAGQSARIAGYARREQDWALQSNAAAGEITMTFKQLRAAQLRQAMAERELHNHRQQIRDAREIERFLTDERKGKTSNEAFYGWLRREARGLYSRCFQLAFDTARKAERALQHELGDSGRTFLQYDYLAGREELLAGERLYLDVKRMELAYDELNRREYELTKHVSLRQVNPRALIELRTAGQCTVDLPEEVFDIDCPGHYFRRLRSVAVSIPCVAGPYASVNCTLTLLKSSVRTSPSVGEGYARVGEDTARFSDYYGVQSIVTSSGGNDTGLFETNLADERYLPFEGSGAVSQWRLELPTDVPQFDYDTISDVILHLRYQAREGGLALRAAATEALKVKINTAATVGSTRLFSVRHEFATEWARFSAAPVDGANPVALTITLRDEHYPFWARQVVVPDDFVLHEVELFASAGTDNVTVYYAATDEPPGSRQESTLTTDATVGGLRTGLLLGELPAAVGTFTLYFNDNSISDLWLALVWGALD